MNRFLPIKPTKSLTYSSFILLVLGVFLLGYFYYYLPMNKQLIQKDGFLTLQTIAGNIADKNTDRQNLYKNFINETYKQKSGSRQAHVDTLLKKNHIDASAQYHINALVTRPRQSTPAELSIRGENLIYQARLGPDRLLVTEAIADFLQPILSTQKAELFDSYALACVDSIRSKLVYHDDNLGIRSDVRLDTLLLRNVEGYLVGVRDIQSPAFNHNIFYYPFKIGTVQLVLCGFARQDLYRQNVRKVPFHFVYPLAILFLLLLVFLPGLKFYIMDADEQVRVSDVVLFGLSVVVGASMLTFVMVQYLLWQGEEDKARRNLKTLSDKIEQNFVRELSEAYACATTLDAFRAKHAPVKKSDFSVEVRRFVNDSLRYSSHFYPFDRVSWVGNRQDSDLGKQLIKAEMVGQPVFTSVQGRNYFKAFQTDDAFVLPDGSDAPKLFGWESIYSQTNADFNITISKPTDGYVVALASKMYSVVNVLLPVGYGFCMIDGDGKVLVHANVNRNLRENLFEKAEPATELRAFAAARQEADINEVSLYQAEHMLHIRPVRGLPYSLVTFYDKGFIVPVNMRILMFAFLFSVLSGLTCGLLWLALARTNFRSHPLLYCPMDYLTWLIPQKRLANYYVHGLVFLIVYLLVSLVFNLWLTNISSYTRFSTVVLTPINVIGGLHVIGATFRRFNGPQPHNGQRRLIAVSAIHLVVSGLVYGLSYYAGYPIDGWGFLLFQGSVNGWMWGYVFINQTDLLPLSRWEASYPVSYTLMLTGLVINLAVLPSALYSWYGYQQERVQTLKKQQLHLATDIRERSRLLMNTAILSIPNLMPGKYVLKRLVEQGIYTTNDDSIALVNNVPRDTGPALFERFYCTITESLSNRYYDLKQYPALADSSADKSWQWRLVKGQVCLWYRNPLPERAVSDANHHYLYIASVLPGNYLFAPGNRGWSVGSLLLLSTLLAWGLYEWLRINTENVFLARYVRSHTPDEPDLAGPVMSSCLPASDSQKDGPDDPWKPADNYATARNWERLNVREKEAARVVRQKEIDFERTWQERREKEKYLLYNFAYDGLLNYKNANDIRRLIDENVLTVDDERLRFADPGFRAFLVHKHGTDEVKSLRAKYQQNSTWQSLQGALLLLLAGFAGFVFLTQEAALNKILLLVSGITTLLSILPKIFRGAVDETSGKS